MKKAETRAESTLLLQKWKKVFTWKKQVMDSWSRFCKFSVFMCSLRSYWTFINQRTMFLSLSFLFGSLFVPQILKYWTNTHVWHPMFKKMKKSQLLIKRKIFRNITFDFFVKNILWGYHKIKHFACYRDFFLHEIPHIKHTQNASFPGIKHFRASHWLKIGWVI